MKLKKFKILVVIRFEEQEEKEIQAFIRKLHEVIREKLDFSGLVTIDYEEE